MSNDILDRLLITLAVRLHAFALCEIQQGWRLVFDPMDAVTVHYVLTGSGTLRVDSAEPVSFSARHMMIVPPGLRKTLEAGPANHEARADTNNRVSSDGLITFTAGDGSRDLLVVCGTISASYAGAFGLFDLLRGPLVEDVSSSAVIRHAFDVLIEEAANPAIGTRAMTEALMKQCLIFLLRHLKQAGADSPIFSALKDARLARVVTAVMEHPAAPYSVESLAAIAGMSRSSFAESFSKAFGEGPIEYVQRVRLRLAAHLLGATDLPVKVIASSIGYQSRSYFSRAFRAAYGVDPSTFRATGGYAEVEPSAFCG